MRSPALPVFHPERAIIKIAPTRAIRPVMVGANLVRLSQNWRARWEAPRTLTGLTPRLLGRPLKPTPGDLGRLRPVQVTPACAPARSVAAQLQAPRRPAHALYIFRKLKAVQTSDHWVRAWMMIPKSISGPAIEG